jgi:hypothetical protein
MFKNYHILASLARCYRLSGSRGEPPLHSYPLLVNASVHQTFKGIQLARSVREYRRPEWKVFFYRFAEPTVSVTEFSLLAIDGQGFIAWVDPQENAATGRDCQRDESYWQR